jgi:hypothetical protein
MDKISIGVVVTVVIQTAAVVWWVAQQAVTIDNLKIEVAKVTDSVKLERQINLERDVNDIKQTLDVHWQEIQVSATLQQIDALQEQIDKINRTVNP